MADLAGRWQDLGVSLGIRPGDLEAIISASAHSPSDCLRKVLVHPVAETELQGTDQLHTQAPACLF